jgi:hypothetical protein
VTGGLLINDKVSGTLLNLDFPGLDTGVDTAPEAAILVITLSYAIAAVFNLYVPRTGVDHVLPKKNPVYLVHDFGHCLRLLWVDRYGQISLAVTTLFWGAGATLQFIVLKWAESALGFTLSQASMVRRWLVRREGGWWWRWWVNAAGSATTGLVMIVIALTKFTHGAWIVVLLIPLLVMTFLMVQILFDGGDQLRHAAKAAAADTYVGDFAEPPLHQAQPGTRSRDEVLLEPWMLPEPRLHAWVLVGRVVVHDDMQREFGRSLDVDLLEETDELLMPMARHAVANHLAVEHAEGRKQGGRAVAPVVVRHGPTAAFLHWKTGLGAVQGWNLTFHVDAQHKGPCQAI